MTSFHVYEFFNAMMLNLLFRELQMLFCRSIDWCLITKWTVACRCDGWLIILSDVITIKTLLCELLKISIYFKRFMTSFVLAFLFNTFSKDLALVGGIFANHVCEASLLSVPDKTQHQPLFDLSSFPSLSFFHLPYLCYNVSNKTVVT